MAKSRKLICGFFNRYISQDQKYKQAPPPKKGKEQTKTQNKFAANQGTSNFYIMKLHFK